MLVVLGTACAHDLARAALLEPRVGPIRAFVAAAFALPSLRPAVYLGFLLLEALITALALDASLRGGMALAASLATVAAQLLLFARTFVRSVWLARCVHEMPTRASRRLPPAEPVPAAEPAEAEPRIVPDDEGQSG
jgi:hypothetical protein